MKGEAGDIMGAPLLSMDVGGDGVKGDCGLSVESGTEALESSTTPLVASTKGGLEVSFSLLVADGS